MIDPEAITPQEPCTFCLGPGPLAASLRCCCTYDCGEEICAASERQRDVCQPVPVFVPLGDDGEPVSGPLSEGGASASESLPPYPVEPPEDVVVGGAAEALTRVLALHERCPCATCSTGHQRPVCKGCPEFWPCSTVRAARGILPAPMPA